MEKYLIVRFSSIGDIVLTTPVIRALRKSKPTCIIHFVTKSAFKGILETNPYLDKVIHFDKDIKDVFPVLKAEKYDHVIDLHKNLRSFHLKLTLRRPSTSFSKINFRKFLLTTFKMDTMPHIHIVDRYFKAVANLGVINDGQGLDFFIPPKDTVACETYGLEEGYITFAIGAQFATKRLPTNRIIELIQPLDLQVVLLGGSMDQENGDLIVKATGKNVVNLCGALTLNESASVIAQSSLTISHDTGLMHIASAFNKPIVSIWGNTVPSFGMTPYIPQKQDSYSIHEVKLNCRPCSKIGFQHCPKGHFKCMNLQDLHEIRRNILTRQIK